MIGTKYKKQILSVNQVVYALLSAVALNFVFLYSTGNIFNLFFFFVFWFLYKKYGIPNLKTRSGRCACLGGLFFSAIFSLGRVGRTNESLLDALSRFKESILKDEYASVVSLSGYSSFPDKLALGTMFVGLWLTFWFIFEQLMKYIEIKSDISPDYKKSYIKKRYFWFIAGIIAICWLPYLIINYPGVLTADSIYQISQIEGDNVLNNKHPLIHTGLISVCWQFARVLELDSNIGVALYSVIQMCILALIDSYTIVVLYKYGLKVKYCICIVAYFALLPLNAMSAITMWKDILFAGFVLWFSTLLFEIFICGENSRKYIILLSISGFFMIMFRSNGIIAYFLCLFFIFLVFKKKCSKEMMVWLFIPVIMSLVISGPIYSVFHIEKGNIVEALSMPLQHIARVVVDCETELSESQIEQIEELAPLDDIKRFYNCRFSDPIKSLMWICESDIKIAENKTEFLKLYLELGSQYPKEFLLAEIDATLGYWYSELQYHTMAMGGYPNGYGITWIFDIHPEWWNILSDWCNLYREIPILGCLYNMGTVFLIILLICICDIYLKKYTNLIISIPVIMTWCTIMIAAPLHAEMRYVYSSMVCVPLIIGNFVLSIQSQKKGEET